MSLSPTSTTPERGEKRESRRAHTKSRAGCLTCKKRRVKCDEGLPRCRNCAIGDRLCSYGDKDHSSRRSHSNHSNHSTYTSSLLSEGNSTGSNLAALSAQHGFTALHMVLLHHATINMASYMAFEGDMNLIITGALTSAPTTPYVLDQLLALSALHLSTQEPATASLFSHQATELQTRALGRFNASRDSLSESTYIPAFLFASLLGIHILRNTLVDHRDSVADFVRALVDYMRIHRGVRAVTSRYWPQILQSELKPLLVITQWTDEAAHSNRAPGTETAQLRTFLASTAEQTLPSSSIDPALDALRWVQWTLDLDLLPSTHPSTLPRPTSNLGVHAALAWPLLVSDTYIHSLSQHRPESLVVLAFFAAALHRHADFWVFGDAGAALVHLIAAHVGPFWTDSAMAWPLQVVR